MRRKEPKVYNVKPLTVRSHFITTELKCGTARIKTGEELVKLPMRKIN